MSGEKEAIGEDRAVRIGRVLDSFLSRREAGESVSEAELYTRHPDIALELRMHLDLLGDLPPAADKIDALITKGLLARSEDPKYPAQLGAYKILDYIGRGGMGIVLKAYEESLDRTVALKILRPELADDRVALERFTREAKAAAALKHPNIVTVHAIGHERGVPFIAMEYVEGPSLAEVIRSVGSPCPTDAADCVGSPRPTDLEDELDAGRAADFSPRGVDLPETNDTARVEARGSSLLLSSSHSSSGSRFPLTTDTIRHIFGQLLEALAAAHDAGLIHRDVKSSNILLTSSSSVPQQSEAAVPHDPEPRTLNPEPSIKLADFGLARMQSSQTRMTVADSILGTPEYMSPEQARGDTDIDHRTDLYSAGVVLYEMLTGRVPFKANTPSAVIHQILNVDPPEPRTFNQDVDPVLASLALRLMAKQPEDRLASAEHAIGALESDRRVRSLELRRRLRRHVAITATVLVVVVCGAWLMRGIPAGESSTDLRVPQPVTHARLDAECRSILVRYGDDAEWKVFSPLAFESYDEVFADVALVNSDGRGNSIVAVGLVAPLDDASSILVALDSLGDELWRIPLHSKEQWPDCQEPRAWWLVKQMVTGDIDGVPGEELVVVAQDPAEAPTRISVVDPDSGEIRSSFWHFGHIHGVRILSGYSPDGRPGILAWGLNNKLDGYADGFREGEQQFAHWDIVHVVMILDPSDMDGLGPPPVHSSRQLRIPPALPRAYALLDRPYRSTFQYVPDTQVRESKTPAPGSRAVQTGGISVIARSRYRANDHSDPWFELQVTATTADGHPIGPVIVDRNFHIRRVGPTTPPATDVETRAFWERYWRLVIQDGKYVAE